MTQADRIGIILAVAITAAAVAFTATGGIGVESDIPQIAEKEFVSPAILDPETQAAQKASQEVQQLSKDIQQRTEKMQETAKEATSAMLPAKLVSIHQGTSIPGCEEVNLCYDPQTVRIFVGGEIIWRNDDTAAHTVTSGRTITGPDGNFGSGLILPGEAFSTMFNESGSYPYFCMIHPWAEGSVSVQ